MMTAMRVAGDEEGNGKGGKGIGFGNKGVGQGMAMMTKRAMAIAMRVAGDKEGNVDTEGNGNSDKGSVQLRRRWQGW